MMNTSLQETRVAILIADGFEEVEMTKPVEALKRAGAKVLVVSPEKNHVQAFRHHDKGITVPVDVPLSHANADAFDALLLPGGVSNPDRLRMIPEALLFVRAFFEKNKPVAAICHAPWLLIEADVVRNRRLTSWPSVRTDLRNAGAQWSDQEAVIDDNLVTSRKPDDIPAFIQSMLKVFAKHSLAHA